MYYSIYDEQLEEFRDDYLNYEDKQELEYDFLLKLEELCDGTEENTENLTDKELWELFGFTIIEHKNKLHEDLYDYYKILNGQIVNVLKENDKLYKISNQMISISLNDINQVKDYFFAHVRKHLNKAEIIKLKLKFYNIQDVAKLNEFSEITGLTFEEII